MPTGRGRGRVSDRDSCSGPGEFSPRVCTPEGGYWAAGGPWAGGMPPAKLRLSEACRGASTAGEPAAAAPEGAPGAAPRAGPGAAILCCGCGTPFESSRASSI